MDAKNNSTPQPETVIEEMTQSLLRQLNLRTELAKLEATEVGAKIAGASFATFVIVLVFFFAFLFFSVMLGFWLAQVLGSNYLGFGAVSLGYLLLGMVMLKFKNQLLVNPIANNLIQKIFNPTHNENS